MPLPSDICIDSATLYFLPVQTRVPYKFGAESLSHVTLARVAMGVRGRDGRQAVGWGETPLSAPWAWPSTLPLRFRQENMARFCVWLAALWADFGAWGHAVEIGHDFGLELERHAREFDAGPTGAVPILAALVCSSAFDLALHDAYGALHNRPTYDTYSAEWMSRDLAHFLEPSDPRVTFAHRFPGDFLCPAPDKNLDAWHSVGLGDALDEADLNSSEPDDGFPNTLGHWAERDGLRCLKVKLRGDDPAWDVQRLRRVGEIGLARGVESLCADFNCTARDVESVCATLDELQKQAPDVYDALLYVEQPFADTAVAMQLDVMPISARKPLFIDESAHDWRAVRLARARGYTGVALKTCKTQTGALLSACWARAHGLQIMVQDLTNPALAMIPHELLSAHVGTLRGLETNAPQFYPQASAPEARVHPGLYERRSGQIDLSTLHGAGFGARVDEIERELPSPTAHVISSGARRTAH